MTFFSTNNKTNRSAHKIIASLISRLVAFNSQPHRQKLACNKVLVLLMQTVSSSYQHGNSWLMMSSKNHPCHSPCLPIIPKSTAFTVFPTVLKPLLVLNDDNENTNEHTNSSSQVTCQLSSSDHNTPCQIFKEQIARRREKMISAMLTLFLSKEAG